MQSFHRILTAEGRSVVRKKRGNRVSNKQVAVYGLEKVRQVHRILGLVRSVLLTTCPSPYIRYPRHLLFWGYMAGQAPGEKKLTKNPSRQSPT